MFIETGNQGEALAASLKESFPAAQPYLLDRFQAIGNKRWANHQNLLDAGPAQILQRDVRKGRQPRIASQSGLESDGTELLGNSGRLHEGQSGPETLRAVAGGVRGTGTKAAIAGGQTMATSGIRFLEVSFGHAMEAEKQMVVVLLEVISSACSQCPDIGRLIEIGRRDRQRDRGRDAGGNLTNSCDGRFKTGHGIVWEQRDDQEVVDPRLIQILDG